MLSRLDVDDVDRVVRRVRDVDPAGSFVHGGVIEGAGAHMGRQIDEAQML